MTVIVNLRFHESSGPADTLDQVRSYGDVNGIEVDENSGFLTIQTSSGDFVFDRTLWKSFTVSARD